MHCLALVIFKKRGKWRKKSHEVVSASMGKNHASSLEAANQLVRATIADPGVSPEDRKYVTSLCDDTLNECQKELGGEHRQTLLAMALKAELLRHEGRKHEGNGLLFAAYGLSQSALADGDSVRVSIQNAHDASIRELWRHLKPVSSSFEITTEKHRIGPSSPTQGRAVTLRKHYTKVTFALPLRCPRSLMGFSRTHPVNIERLSVKYRHDDGKNVR